MLTQLNKHIKPISDRIKNMVARGVVKGTTDTGKIQRLQVALLADELKDDMERFQNYGFSSVPHAGAEAAVMFMGGNRDHGVVIAVDDKRYRMKGLEGGEVAIYTDEGDSIVLKRNGNIEIKAATKIRIETPRLEVTGDIIDNCDTQPDTVQEMRNVYNAHTHKNVTPGSGNSGIPNQDMGT